MRGAALTTIIALTIVIMPSLALAFGTLSVAGQNREHEFITRLALQNAGLGPETMDEIAGKDGRFGAVGAPDSPDRGLLTKPYAHCDGADHLDIPGYPQTADQAYAILASCRSFIMRSLSRAVEAAGRIADQSGRVDTREIPSLVPCSYNGKSGRAKCDVLAQLGLAFHASQDFYSHTNWTDRALNAPIGPLNPPGLGNSGRAPWLDPRGRAGPVPGLISGCFEGKPERANCLYADLKDRVRHRVLNKDEGTISLSSGRASRGTTIRGAANDNFSRAVDAAIADTRDKWAWFNGQVVTKYGSVRGEAILCAIRNDDENACR
ncbi:MAG: hypothetical protein KDJ67_18030 [Nitratireductor sp.]|nr:hypothetical protein [Nitratireductor sp.]